MSQHQDRSRFKYNVMDEDERASKDALEKMNTLETLSAENFE